ncbi:MAG: glycoside hydrolase [Clostridia bacterium]|nr:glycoside hydrolase [Clostridia bacterium]
MNVLPDGTVLCCYECRLSDSDWSAAAVGLRRVFPGGTVGERLTIADGTGRNAVGNPVLFVSGRRVVFLYCENYKRVFCRASEDGGISFGEPREITYAVEKGLAGVFWSVIATGPGHGTALDSGRLIAPVWFASDPLDFFSHHPSRIACLYSDDGGVTWDLSPPIDTGGIKDPSECCLGETGEGLMISIRNENESRRRFVSFSGDGGLTWSACRETDLRDPVCCAGMCRAGNGLLFSNCDSETERRDLTLKRLGPDGNVLETLSVSASGGYSDVIYDTVRGAAYILFEHNRGLRLAKTENMA